ncbi:MAG TPA: aspartyl protease family protein [Bryobacteraceae bacterium]|nr:aspartyl protease family protein [Bryobacteraceae bacterium]
MTPRAARFFATLILAASSAAAQNDDPLAAGRKALRNDGVATAWRLAQQTLSDHPQLPAAHEFAAEVLFRRGEFAQAEAEFQSAAKLDSKHALAWWGLARVSECESMNKTAREYFQRAYDLDPKEPRILRDWAMRQPGQRLTGELEKNPSPLTDSSDPEDYEQRLQLAKAAQGRTLNVLVSPYRKTEIPLAPLMNNGTRMRSYGLDVSVNGTVLRLLLDTGASGIVLPRRAAERAGVTRLAQATLRGFGDSSRPSAGYRGIAQRVRIGDVEYRDALISVADQESIGIADGLIGTNVFAPFLITLDFAGRTLRLDPLPGYQPAASPIQDRVVPPGLEHAARVFRFGHLLLLPTRVNGSRESLFVLDTGADRTLISYDLASEVSRLAPDARMRMSGINGRVVDLYQTGDVTLQFAGFEQKSLGMSSIDTWEQSRRVGTEISGFLALPVLDLFTLTIDYRDGLVNFARKAN